MAHLAIDLSPTMSHAEAAPRIEAAQHRITQLRLFTAGLLEPGTVGPGLLVIFEGFDAAGKGGAIRRLTASLDPRHVRVVPIGAPTEEELRHHFLWRFEPLVPGIGEMTVFDRSWYGRVLVERVEGLIDADTVALSLKEIVQFEEMLANDHTLVVKFWLHISADEQKHRFDERAHDPMKRWKLTDEDWRNREKREEYLDALDDMIKQTNHPRAKWNIIAAESKPYARVTILETLIAIWEADLVSRGFTLPTPTGGDYLH
jgi:polyphosphate kinase 2 (PPK2 family)